MWGGGGVGNEGKKWLRIRLKILEINYLYTTNICASYLGFDSNQPLSLYLTKIQTEMCTDEVKSWLGFALKYSSK